jgi:hypothetical protein
VTQWVAAVAGTKWRAFVEQSGRKQARREAAQIRGMGKSAIGTGLAGLAVLVASPDPPPAIGGSGRLHRGPESEFETPLMTNFPEKIASALMESIMAAFRTETADLQRLADEVDAAGQDVEKIRAAIERHGNRRTQAMETIRTMLTAEVAEFKRELGIG